MQSLIRNLPLTRIRLSLAAFLYRLLKPFLPRGPRVFRRNRISFELELSEGIDFSIFLLGTFQRHVSIHLPPGNAVVLDIGANIGSVCLPIARKFPSAEIHAFEPTDYAFRKLTRNVELNPDLASRLKLVKCYLSSASRPERDFEIFARWPLSGSEQTHEVHGGMKEKASRTPTLSLDDYVERNGLRRVDFIKIDTDGHELEVLRGAERTLRRFQPTVVFEVGIYLLRERGYRFEQFLEIFEPLGYRFRDLQTGDSVTRENFASCIPQKSTTDILASPEKGSLNRQSPDTPPKAYAQSSPSKAR